jgi:hypothetical protein
MKNITNFDFTELKQFDKIFCLVSGGIDSTYLYEMIKQECGSDRLYPVNCFNPYESSKTLIQLQHEPHFIEVKPAEAIDYKQILYDSFLKIPAAYQLRRQHKYQKKVFPCCRLIKHEAFLHDLLFKEPNTVVISGIKRGDGTQRRIFLTSLENGHGSQASIVESSFYLRHQGGQYFCYPFRDYRRKEFPEFIIKQLRKKYSFLTHSGCCICPVLVVFQDKIKKEPRMAASLRYWNSLNGQQLLHVGLK